jgi:Sec-independent protein translocase protein TatA
MGFSETIFLFFLALLIFGPKRLPEIARQVGKVMNDLRRASYEFKAQIEAEISNLEMDNKPLPPAPRPLGAVASLLAKPESVESVEPATADAQPSPNPKTPPLKAPDA